jgi:phytoene dehydrogenase-like protein
VCAAYLGKAGLRTVVLERRERVGGGLATSEIAPGARVPALACTVGRFRASIARDLDLYSQGLRLVQPHVRAVSLSPGEAPLTLWGDPQQTAAEVADTSRRDAASWLELDRRVRAHARVLDRLMTMTPPDPASPAFADLLGALRVGLRYRGLGAADAREFLRVLPMPIADLLEDHFETDRLRAAVAVRGMRYTSLGPRSAGSTQVMLADSAGNNGGLAGETVYARGGPGALAVALASAGRSHGAEIRTAADVVAIRESGGRATGVALASGEEIGADVIVGGIDPKRLLLGLVDPEALGPQLGWQAGNLRLDGVTAKVNIGLAELPQFRDLDGDAARERLRGRILIAPDLAYLDRAADAAKYGTISSEPWLEATIPSLVDPLLVDGGARSGVKHVMSVLVQSAPYRLREADWNACRDELGDLAIRTLERVAPGIGSLVTARQVLTPLDLERDHSYTGGHPLHGEPSLDQWFAWRPLLGWARYRMPLEGLYLCGAGAHPGGGVTGMPGRNAAREILADWRRRR